MLDQQTNNRGISVVHIDKQEKLFIWRRRKGYTQREAASELGISLRHYGMMERGEVDFIEATGIRKLEDFEICLLLRRRRGLRQRDIAIRVGCSRAWIHQMETGLVPISKELKTYLGA